MIHTSLLLIVIGLPWRATNAKFIYELAAEEFVGTDDLEGAHGSVVELLSSDFSVNQSHYAIKSVPPGINIPLVDDNWTVSIASNVDDGPPRERVNLGFTFPFYGHGESVVYIDSNGFVTFAPGWACRRSGFCLWSRNTALRYPRIIAPLMTDIDPSSSSTERVLYNIGTTGTKRYLSVVWQNVTLYRKSTMSPLSFQLTLYDDGEIHFNYHRLDYNPANQYLSSRGRRFYFPLYVGVEDASVSSDGRHVRRYGRVTIPFSALSLDRTIVMKALLGCSEGVSNCSSCVQRGGEIYPRIYCGWCSASQRCSDPYGFYYYQNAENTCTPENLRRSDFECDVREISGFCGPDLACISSKKKAGDEDESSNIQTIPILVGVAIGFVFFTLSITLTKTVFNNHCINGVAGVNNEGSRRFSITESKAWLDAGPESEEKELNGHSI